MNDQTFETLELDELIALLEKHAQTPMGHALVLGLRPSTDRGSIEHALDLTTESAALLQTGARLGLSGISDPDPALALLQIEGTSLEPLQILAFERLIAVGMDLRAMFRNPETRELCPKLSEIAARTPDLRGLLGGMRGKILPDGSIDDNASPELRSLRRTIQISRERIHRSLESIMRKQDHAVQDDIVTFRHGRFVIPIRTDSRGQVPGVMHGLSSSGQTTFVEPLAVIEHNNELVRLREQEEMEIARILHEISDSLRESLEALRAVVSALAELDFAQARAKLSLEFQCVRPAIDPEARLRVLNLRHIPLQHNLGKSGEKIVPISFELAEGQNVLVISGPNAGGKTVVLKTVGLAALMAQMGLHVPAEEAALPVYRRMYADIGDQQSIAANLSTFTAHMRNIAAMARGVDTDTLLLLDEVGTGTDPQEGAALAVAIVDHFRRTGATTMATTHYNELKMWATGAEGVLNASVEFDEATLKPTYRLISGVAGASAGFEIARRMEVPDAILGAGKAMLSPDQARATDYLKKIKASADELEAKKAALEAELAETARLRRQLKEDHSAQEEARKAKFEKALEKVLGEHRRESERLIAELKDRAAAEKVKRTASAAAARLAGKGRRLRAQAQEELGLAAAAEGAPAGDPGRQDEPREGDLVLVQSLDKQGVVESASEDTFTIRIGALRFRARRDELMVLAAPGDKPAAEGQGRTRGAVETGIDADFNPELKVIGQTADEAVAHVDKFLDEAFLAGVESVRIIHGHGKGILRKAIAELLTGHPQVKGFEPAPPNQGGSGATIAFINR